MLFSFVLFWLNFTLLKVSIFWDENQFMKFQTIRFMKPVSKCIWTTVLVLYVNSILKKNMTEKDADTCMC